MNEPEKEPRLILGFWEMGIIGTLMVVFFPWSLLFCVLVYGLEDKKVLVIVIVQDVAKNALAILAVCSQILSKPWFLIISSALAIPRTKVMAGV